MSFFKKYHKKTDEELIEFIKEGKSAAFDELYKRYSQRLLVYFYRMLGGDEEKAQDFLQDIFLRLIEKSHLFSRKARFSTWIYTIANNMCKNEYRRLDIRKNEVNPNFNEIEYPVIEKHIDLKSFDNALWQEVNMLDEKKRSTFLLRYQEHLSIAEISKILECSPGTVKSRLFYTTKHLADKLEHFNPKKGG